MNRMLILLDRLDIEGYLPELGDIAKSHKIAKMYLARITPDYGARVRSIVAPHKLEMAEQMTDAAAGRYLDRIADALREKGLEFEIISRGMRPDKIDDFIRANEIDLIVSMEKGSDLSQRGTLSAYSRNSPYTVRMMGTAGYR